MKIFKLPIDKGKFLSYNTFVDRGGKMKKGVLKSDEYYKKPSKFEEFIYNVKDWFYWNGTVFLVVAALSISLLGGLHHMGYAMHRVIQDEKNKAGIEMTIAETDEFTNFAMDEISVSEKDGKKYVNIYGSFKMPGENKSVYGVASYEISEELFEKINRYVKTTFEYNSYGEPVSAETEPRYLKYGDNAKAYRVYYKALKEIRKIVEEQPMDHFQSFVGGALQNDIEAE